MGVASTQPTARAPVPERLRYLATFGEHVALAAALRALPRPKRRPAGDAPLRAVVLSPHPPSHLGTQVRFTRWAPHFERLGCRLEVLTPSTDEQFDEYKAGAPGADTRYHHACMVNQWRNIRRAADADAVVLHRGLFPFSPWQRATFERLLARLNPHLVYDFYDPIWVERRGVSEVARSRLSSWLHPPDKIEQVIRLARVVTASNVSLAQFARELHGDVRVIPMLLEPDDYEPRRHEERSPVVLGWLGSANNLPRLLSVAPALRRLAESRDIVVHVVSSEEVHIPGVPVRSFTHPWSPESERKDLAALDIGLVPLDEASVTDKDKSPFKLLQYLTAGLAVVATPIAIDFSVIDPGECFLPASTEDEWVGAMTRLVDDAALRARLGSAARQAVVEHYSFAGHAAAFLDTLTTAAGRPAPSPGRGSGRKRVLVLSLSAEMGMGGRVQRQVEFLAGEYDVILAGFSRPPPLEDVEVIQLPSHPLGRSGRPAESAARAALRGLGRYGEAYWRDTRVRRWREALERALPVDAIVVNDLFALPMARSLAPDVPVIFDAHEHWTSESESWSRLRRTSMRGAHEWIVDRHVARCAAVTTVSPPIVREYAERTGVPCSLVTNAPHFQRLSPSEVSEPIRLFHVGVADERRRLEDTIEAVCSLGGRFTLDLALARDNDYRRRLERLAAPHDFIRVLPPVPQEDLVSVANSYDVGVHLMPVELLNHRYALPNKLFDYIQARLAVAIGPSPAMAQVLEEWDCGVVSATHSPEDFSAALGRLDAEEVERLKRNADRAAQVLNAESNRETTVSVVRQAIEGRPRASRPVSIPSP